MRLRCQPFDKHTQHVAFYLERDFEDNRPLPFDNENIPGVSFVRPMYQLCTDFRWEYYDPTWGTNEEWVGHWRSMTDTEYQSDEYLQVTAAYGFNHHMVHRPSDYEFLSQDLLDDHEYRAPVYL